MGKRKLSSSWKMNWGSEAGSRTALEIDRVVFISVPQWGTNIADWVYTYSIERKFIVAELRAMVKASQVPLVDAIQRFSNSAAASLANTDLIFAIQDALREAEADTPRTPMGTAKAQEAAS